MKEKRNKPREIVERDMVEFASKRVLEGKSHDFVDGWEWCIREIFKDPPNYRKYIFIPSGKSGEFYKGLKETHEYISVFYNNVTAIVRKSKVEVKTSAVIKKDYRVRKPNGVHVGAKLEELLIATGWSCQEFAQKIGSSTSQAYSWRSNFNAMSPSYYERFKELRRQYDLD